MEYVKKILVLKELNENGETPLTKRGGIARIEVENGVSYLFLSLINFPVLNKGSYSVFIVDGSGRLFYFDLGSHPVSFSTTFNDLPDVEKGFSVGIVSLIDGLPVTLCYSKSEEITLTLNGFKKAVNEKCLELKKSEDENKSLYNDEAVATENYYTIDEQIADKLNEIKEGDENKKEESASTPFIVSEQKELDEIFNKFPPYTLLDGAFKQSKFVKITYYGEKYYVVGIVTCKNDEQFVCYGIPSVYSSAPPEELKNRCQFVPLSRFNPFGEGFFMMFQSAVTGECVLNPEIVLS